MNKKNSFYEIKSLIPLNRHNRCLEGFTLIELLIVIAIIAALAAIAFVALNPLARFQDSRNAQRWAAVNEIIEGIKLDQIDNGGTYFTDLEEDVSVDLYYQIGAGSDCDTDTWTCDNPTVVTQTACLDLSELVDEGYIASAPIDPNATGATASETRYYLIKNTSGLLTVGSCSEEIGSNAAIPAISVSR